MKNYHIIHNNKKNILYKLFIIEIDSIHCSISSMPSDIAKRKSVWQYFLPAAHVKGENKVQIKAEGRPG